MAENGFDLGKAYIQIVPSAQGITQGITDALSGNGVYDSISKNVSSLTMQAAGQTISSMATPLIKGFESIVDSASKFEAGMSEVKAISGTTADEMERLSAVAMEEAAKSKFTTEQATEALKYMAMAGWDDIDMMNSLGAVMTLAGASGEDLGTTADILTDAMTAFGLAADGTTKALGKDGYIQEVSNAAHFSDVLAVASSKSNTNVSMLGESFKYVAPVAGSLGYTVEDTAIALGLMANNGIKSSMAGTTLRTILTNLAKPTEDMEVAMYRLGVSLTDDEGNMLSLKEVMDQLREGFSGGTMTTEEFNGKLAELTEKLNDGTMSEQEYENAVESLTIAMYGAEGAEKAKLAAMLAGKTGMAGLLAIINTTDEEYQGLTSSIYTCNGATQEMYDIMTDNAQGALDRLDSAINVLATSMGQALLPLITELVEGVTGLVNWFNELDPGMQKVIFTVAAFGLALGPVLSVVGNFITVLGAISPIVTTIQGVVSGAGGVISGVISMLSGGVSSLFALVAANPVVLVVAAISAAVVALGVVIYKHWDDIKAGLSTLGEAIGKKWDEIKTVVGEKVSALKDAIVFAFEKAKTQTVEMWEGLKEFFSQIWQGIQGVFSNVGEWFGEKFSAAKEAIANAWSNITDMFSTVWNGIKGVFQDVAEWFMDVFANARDAVVGVWKNVVSAFQIIWQGIQSVFSGVVQFFGTLFSSAASAVISAWAQVQQAFAVVRQNIQNLYGNIHEWFAQRFIAARQAIETVWTNITGVFQRALTAIQSVFSSLPTWFGNLFAKARDMAVSAWNGIKAKFAAIWSGIKSAFNIKEAFTWGKDLITNFVSGVASTVSGVVKAISGVAGAIKRIIGFSQPEEGPLSDFDTYPVDMMNAYADGITANADVVQAAAADAFDLKVDPAEQAGEYADVLKNEAIEALQASKIDWSKYDIVDAEGLGKVVDVMTEDIHNHIAGSEMQEHLKVELGIDYNDAALAAAAVNPIVWEPSDEEAELADQLADSSIDWSKYADEYWYSTYRCDGATTDLIHNVRDLQSSTEDLQEYLMFEYNIEADDALEMIQITNDYLAGSSEQADSTGDAIADLGIDISGAADNFAGLTSQASESSAALIEAATDANEVSFAAGNIATALHELTENAVSANASMDFDCVLESNAYEIADDMSYLDTATLGASMSTLDLSSAVETSTQTWETYGDTSTAAMDSLLAGIDASVSSMEVAGGSTTSLTSGMAAMAEAGQNACSIMSESFFDLSDSVSYASDAVVDMADITVENMGIVSESQEQTLDELISGIPDFVDAGGDMAEGVGQGFLGRVSSAIEKIKEFGQQIIQGFKSFFGIASPSTVFAELGGYLIDGLLQGISSAWQSVVSFFAGAWDGIKSVFTGAAEWFGSVFDGTASAISAAWSGVPDLFVTAWQSIQSVFDGVSEWFSNTFTGAREAAAAAWETITESFQTIWTNIQTVFEGAGTWFQDTFTAARDLVITAWESVTESFTQIWNNVQAVFGDVADWFGQTFTAARDNVVAIWTAITDSFRDIWQSIQEVFSSIVSWFQDIFTQAREAVVNVWSAIVDSFRQVKENIVSTYQDIADRLSAFFQTARDRIATAWEGLETVFQTVRSKVEGVWESFADWAGKISEQAENKFVSAWNNVKSKFSNVWKNIKEAFSLKDAVNWGKDLVSNFSSGISSAISAAKRAANSISSTIRSYIHFSEPDVGPLSDFHTYGPDMVKTFADDILSNQDYLKNALDKTFSMDTPRITADDLSVDGLPDEYGGAGSGNMMTGNTFNFYSPKELDPVTALRQAKREAQRLALAM